jgi:hypothetical protein
MLVPGTRIVYAHLLYNTIIDRFPLPDTSAYLLLETTRRMG